MDQTTVSSFREVFIVKEEMTSTLGLSDRRPNTTFIQFRRPQSIIVDQMGKRCGEETLYSAAAIY